MAQLTSQQIEFIGECLSAAAYGPFFPTGEFPSVFGLSKDEVAQIADEWPVSTSENVDRAVHNSILNLWGYPIKKDKLEHWEEYLSIERSELKSLLEAWRKFQD